MSISLGLRESDLTQILSVLKNQPEITEALIFGSRAKGNYKNGSDVDIALKGDISFQKVSQVGFMLNEQTLMPYKFDVLNFHTIQNSDLIEHINRVGVLIYKAT